MDSNADPDAFPTVRQWLADASPTIIWAELLANPGQFSDVILQPLDVILTALDKANPKRLAGKRRTFRTDADQSNQLNLRVELLIGCKLAEAGLSFDFGGDGEPDIVCATSTVETVHIEVTTRARDDVALLHDEMEAALVDTAVLVELRVPQRQLAINASDRRAMCDRVREAVQAIAGGGHVTVPLTEVGGQAVCTGIQPIGPSHVVLNIGAALADHMSNVERELFNVIAIKSKQAKRDGWPASTLLIVDASRLGLSWLRPEAVWTQMLPTLAIDWPDLPFVGLLVAFTSLDSTRLGGVCMLRPDASDALRAALSEVVAAFGMPPFDS